ncbi:MAG TPA: winged helix-turn-helix transcriptional regulator [Roseateles sp.]|nr:winged helix-turn-helix transcriptional regulator [Roseateles sp.]
MRRLVAEDRLSRREMAGSLGLSERTFYRRLKALGLS